MTPMPEAKRPTAAEVAERVEMARHFLALGMLKCDIKARIRAVYGATLDHRTIEGYLARAREANVLRVAEERGAQRQESLDFYRAVQAEPLVDFRDKIKARERIDKLLGLELKL